MSAFEATLPVAWSHLDANGHMANTAYLDVVVDVRFRYFASRGFPPEAFREHRIGPVVKRDEVEYFKELHLLQPVRITLRCAGLSEDATRFVIVNELYRPDGELAARVTSTGGWLDLVARKLTAPPEALALAMRALERTPDYAPIAARGAQ